MMGIVTEHPLADLVRDVHDTSGLSYRDLAERAKRAGHEISHSQLQAYASRMVTKTPTDRQVRAIAAAVDRGYEEVRAAVFQEFYGYTPRELRNFRGSRLAAMLPDDLPPEDERTLIAMIEAFLRSRAPQDNAE